ncbi:MAG: PIN domain-containing protein, partial [Bacteroidota bacterium]
ASERGHADDIAFVSLNEFLNARLWTGDKELIQGLSTNGYDKIITTEGLLELQAELENKKKKGG